ncbi:EAL domain, c-di-GMP-specific phosphodiesterase class I (or its enzymatically inactive variant) [Thioclava dalianensis]|nr:EAL domain-containing protein [Thioclava dalianensis]SFN03300.1 EAL domain, c-di-GMP-specific phosphodiesterase class I (or its enzymatically inactive variant) [Thioclava dalianensis]
MAMNQGMRLSGRGASSKPAAGPVLLRRELVVFLPAVALAGLWFGLEGLLLLGLTALLVAWMTRPLPPPALTPEAARDPVTGLPLRAEAEAIMESYLTEAMVTERRTACIVVGFDAPELLLRQMPRSSFEDVMQRSAERLSGMLRDSDRLAWLEEARFAVMLRPSPALDQEALIQLSAKLQTAFETPISLGSHAVQPTCHIGFCRMDLAPSAGGSALIRAACTAASEAARNGHSAIRSYSRAIQDAAKRRSELEREVIGALENGQIRAFFQPQLSTDTGAISGLQAIPRWLHRKRGMLTENDILSAVKAADLETRFAEVMLLQALSALRDFDSADVDYGPVSLPLCTGLLRNPKLVDRLKWEFDRFEIGAQRICLIVHQDALAQHDDATIADNLARIDALGCRIELAMGCDGPISAPMIRRAKAHRLCIHRAFIARIDQDPEQQRIVAAIIALSEGLGVQTVGDGTKSLGEHALLGQLGCNLVQGPAVAPPIPLEELGDWSRQHRTKLDATPRIDSSGRI